MFGKKKFNFVDEYKRCCVLAGELARIECDTFDSDHTKYDERREKHLLSMMELMGIYLENR